MIRIRLEKQLTAASGPLTLAVDLSIRSGELIAINGPSGSGKTTLLRLIAGLANPQRGYIRFLDHIWLDTEKKIRLRPQQRQVGLVFQDYTLFPNMTVRQNLQYALAKGQAAESVTELIEKMELQALADHYPATLSGGQKQRVALARALVRKPSLLLLDEPLSALDAKMRSRLQDYILRIHEEYQLTTILVSHDLREVFRMADQVFTLQQGQLSPLGAPDELLLSDAARGFIQLRGEILSIEENGPAFVINVLVGSNVIQAPLHPADLAKARPGDEVLLEAGNFRPIFR